ncbi:MAG: N-6 DNA methylase [Kofleriaceae bacterium]|nr:N-6 DNA methylase [Kofleriaceae bacterium]
MSEEPSRHQLGQWFTPDPVVDLVLALVMHGRPRAETLLDPSCGDGAFLRRAKAAGIAVDGLHGVDVDPRALASAGEQVPAASLHHRDFFDQASTTDFDLVVGNPPYVRQERLGQKQKALIQKALSSDWPSIPLPEIKKLVGRGDLAAPFLLRTIRLLAENGRAAFVLSSALLDSAYGAQLWRLLGKLATVEYIVDAPSEQWFSDASVHTCIVVLRAGASDDPVQIGRLKCSTEKAAKAIAAGKELRDICTQRLAAQNAPETWPASLRAPDTWHQFSSRAGGTLIQLGDIATIRRGITSGANDIFYISKEQTSGVPKRFLFPLLRSPSKEGLRQIEFDTEINSQSVLLLHGGENLESEPGLSAYLNSFTGAETRKSLAARTPWWSLKAKSAQVFLCKSYADRFIQPYATGPVFADQRLYCVHAKAGVDAELLSAVLNSTMTALALESLGRASMGQGVLEWSTADIRTLPVVDPGNIGDVNRVLSAFRSLRRRAQKTVGENWDSEYRRELDSAVLASWPDILTMREAIVESLIETCLARNLRGKSVHVVG